MKYLGFSTADKTKKGFSLSGKELINRDLLNHIYTLKGERVNMPNFGTIIPMIAFEQLDQLTLKAVEDDLRGVVDYDPRVELVDIAVMALPDNNAITAVLDLKYLSLNEFDSLHLEFKTD
jgi:phage baseplate assembly protein W